MNSDNRQFDYDVFLCHNHFDKPELQKIKEELVKAGIRPFLDELDLPIGHRWADYLPAAMDKSRFSAIFIGNWGLGNTQQKEIRHLRGNWFSKDIPFIPVYLLSAPQIIQLPDEFDFLMRKDYLGVDFRSGGDRDAIGKLIRPIRGTNSQNNEPPINQPPGDSIQPIQSATQKIDSNNDSFKFKSNHDRPPAKVLDPTESINRPEIKEEDDDLRSERGVDYTRLRDLLKAQNWKAADQETLKVMLQAASKQKEGWLDSDSMKNFPCTDLRTIDQLWVKYSNGHFGFSVQKRIWEDCGKNDVLFGYRVGWRKHKLYGGLNWLGFGWKGLDEIEYSLESKKGHLPVVEGWWVGVFGVGVVDVVSFIASRLVECNI